ncbi:vWA domain-containing protein [Caldifermentibacillus hisashii]|uniref:vWA domain-containing protein n=2 Tax=Caldifermentibacillus hisashii TaxID=996558 RepID=UPI00310100E7
MKLIIKYLTLLAILFFVLYGCNSNHKEKAEEKLEEATETNADSTQQTKNENKEVKKTTENIQVEPLPSTYTDLAKLPIGEYANITLEQIESDNERKKIISNLPDISGNPSKKELDYFYRELLRKLQKDYEGPENLINRLKFEFFGAPDSDNSRYQFKENLNVIFIIDSSGSMAQKIDGREKMASAKESILKFVSKLPKDAKVGIRVYGHKGTGSDADKALSCSSSELVYPISNYNEGEFQAALNKFSPSGWTPIGLALREAKNDLASFDGANNTNIVYLVSDGIDTCDDQPIEAAKDLYSSNISPIINVIGFDVDSEGQNQLKQIAAATDGIYDTVTNEGELQEQLEKLNDLTNQWQEWLEMGKQQYEYKKVSNSLDIFTYIAGEQIKAEQESTNIYIILSRLKRAGMFDDKSFEYLRKRNSEYHEWIDNEISKFNEELKALNEQNYNEAINQLQEKYKANTQ